jgi:5-methyltetrahydropteroyltriglutamate--homocysteine methyltransferase
MLPTTLVGSYAQPEWLIDRKKLAGRFPPRTRARELWRIPPEFLEAAQDDATLLAIRDQERAGLDIITDGEMRRESYSNRFATALEGVDIDNPGTALDRSGHPNPVPRIVGKIRRKHPVEIRDVQFLRANTDRMIKMTVPGPYTMSQQAQNDFYKDETELVMDYAAASMKKSVISSAPEPTSFRSTSLHAGEAGESSTLRPRCTGSRIEWSHRNDCDPSVFRLRRD